jgi:hypothetical protein
MIIRSRGRNEEEKSQAVVFILEDISIVFKYPSVESTSIRQSNHTGKSPK